jgi:hypothetical protein
MTGGFTSEYGNRLAAARPQHAFGRRSRRARRREFPRRHRRESRSQCRLPAGIAAWVIASLWMVLLPGASSIPRNRRSFTTSARDRESPAQFDGHAGNQEEAAVDGRLCLRPDSYRHSADFLSPALARVLDRQRPPLRQRNLDRAWRSPTSAFHLRSGKRDRLVECRAGWRWNLISRISPTAFTRSQKKATRFAFSTRPRAPSVAV